jgi:hypothetical protein
MFAGTEKITFPSRYIEVVAGKSPSQARAAFQPFLLLSFDFSASF